MFQFQFPENLEKLAKNLRTLDFSENKIAVIPTYLGSFSQLKALTFNSNRIGKIIVLKLLATQAQISRRDVCACT